MVNSKKLLSLIGLATRARKVVSGEFSTEKSVKSGRSRMVIVSEEASDNTKKMFTNMCAHYKVPIYLFGTKDELGHSVLYHLCRLLPRLHPYHPYRLCLLCRP